MRDCGGMFVKSGCLSELTNKSKIPKNAPFATSFLRLGGLRVGCMVGCTRFGGEKSIICDH